jgi:bacterioferritin-associated ferredoxin
MKEQKVEWINNEASIVDEWQVDVAFDKSQQFSVGHLYLTDQQIQIEAAGGLCHMGDLRDQLPINEACNHLIARYDQIRSVEIQKQFLLFNYLILTLKSNHMLRLKFGFESARRAKQRIIEKIA